MLSQHFEALRLGGGPRVHRVQESHVKGNGAEGLQKRKSTVKFLNVILRQLRLVLFSDFGQLVVSRD